MITTCSINVIIFADDHELRKYLIMKIIILKKYSTPGNDFFVLFLLHD